MAFMTASQLSQHYQSVLKPANKPECEISQVTSTAEKYEVKLSINQFEPEELCVKVVDRYVNVEGRHDEKNDKIGFFTRQFTRRYFLPEGVQPETIRCTYNVDTHLLTISAPVVNKVPVKEYTIPILIVGQQHRQHHQKQEKQKQEQQQPQPTTSSSSRQEQKETHQNHHQKKQHQQQQQSQSQPMPPHIHQTRRSHHNPPRQSK